MKPQINRLDDAGPFDIVGDVHGCLDELQHLLRELGYVDGQHPAGRRLIFVGDLVDRGPDSAGVLRLVMDLVAKGVATGVPGNHDLSLVQMFGPERPRMSPDRAVTVVQVRMAKLQDATVALFAAMPHHLVLDGGRLVVAHGGLREEWHGQDSGLVQHAAIHGERSEERDAFGGTMRRDWAADYRGKALVVYGHTPVPAAVFRNNTINLDTGCVFGGSLTALRYPELELVSVPAAREYSPPVKFHDAAP